MKARRRRNKAKRWSFQSQLPFIFSTISETTGGVIGQKNRWKQTQVAGVAVLICRYWIFRQFLQQTETEVKNALLEASSYSVNSLYTQQSTCSTHWHTGDTFHCTTPNPSTAARRNDIIHQVKSASCSLFVELVWSPHPHKLITARHKNKGWIQCLQNALNPSLTSKMNKLLLMSLTLQPGEPPVRDCMKIITCFLNVRIFLCIVVNGKFLNFRQEQFEDDPGPIIWWISQNGWYEPIKTWLLLLHQ